MSVITPLAISNVTGSSESCKFICCRFRHCGEFPDLMPVSGMSNSILPLGVKPREDKSSHHQSAGTGAEGPLWSRQAGSDPNKVQLARFMIIPCYAQIIFRQFHIRCATVARTAQPKSPEREFITPNVNNKEDKSLYSRPPQKPPPGGTPLFPLPGALRIT